MRLEHEHAWDLTPAAARALQLELRRYVETEDRLGTVTRVAGVDVGFDRPRGTTRAAVVVLSFPELVPCDRAIAESPTRSPYVPGLLSFREAPAILEALAMLGEPPDLILCDGHGFAHPRRFGIACHLGVVTGLPSIGVGKTRLIGSHPPVPDERGANVPLSHEGETIGAVLRSRSKVKPIYVSIGHRLTLDTAVEYVMRCTTRFRLPETTRHADRLASGKT